MKIAYITVQDSTNIRSFSGTGYYVPRSLEMQGAKIHYIGNLKTKPYLLEKSKELYHQYIKKKKYWFNRDPLVLKNYAKQIQHELNKTEADALVSISAIPMTMLETDIPIVIWVDAVFPDIIDFYPEFTNMADATIHNGYEMEKISLNRSRHLVFSSHWAAASAMKNYHIPAEKVSVIPYGANIETAWDRALVERLIQAKRPESCKLMFVGVDWERKGGDVACQTAQILNESGLPTELHVLGSSPGADLNRYPEYVHFHGFISKETPEGKKKIHDLISESHFLILPTRADCTPIVFAEFNSYGIPCLTTRVGGIETLIKEGRNGKTFPLSSPASDYAEFIKSLFMDYDQYTKLAINAYDEYVSRLNWETSGKKMIEVLENNIQIYDYESSHIDSGA